MDLDIHRNIVYIRTKDMIPQNAQKIKRAGECISFREGGCTGLRACAGEPTMCLRALPGAYSPPPRSLGYTATLHLTYASVVKPLYVKVRT